jgi:hypothetical protein
VDDEPLAASAPVKPLPILAAQFFFVRDDTLAVLWVTFASERWPSVEQSSSVPDDKRVEL